MKKIINYNSRIFTDDDPGLPAANRSYRYGDGLFETMKMINGKIILANFHFERLIDSMNVLKIYLPKLVTVGRLEMEILELCEKNGCSKRAKIRLSISRGNGGLYENNSDPQYLIECWPLEDSKGLLNEKGLLIDIYPDAQKSMDKFSNLKSANYLPYTMAALWAKENKLNDALILNSAERVCEATIANVFWSKDGIIYTPPLSEGCIAGVMRRYLLENLPASGFKIKEKELETKYLEDANEVFLTNAILGIRWVKQFRNKSFVNIRSLEIFNKLIRDFG